LIYNLLIIFIYLLIYKKNKLFFNKLLIIKKLKMYEEYTKNIDKCWKPIFEKHKNLIEKIFLQIEESKPHNVYPPKNQIFRVFEKNVLDIKLVLLGQDSYHGEGQANGLAFSVEKNIKIPPSLVNIYKEIKNTYPEKNYEFPHGDLTRWFEEENIFLLNCGLCVYEGKPGSFLSKWLPFTDDIIKFIYENNNKCIFFLLGNFAKEKGKFIDDKKRIISESHPSPLGAHKGFLGSKIFTKIDEKFETPINWSI
jgi:uracil-DNA glycosylase